MIDNMNISSFGAVRDKKIEFAPGLNIVLGNNELGKSTIHEALRTVLYGFSPATLSAHPYGPWDGSRIFIEADIRSEGYFSVSRALGDRPEGKLIEGSSLKSIANGPIRGIGNISRDIYRQLYAITLDDLSAISDKSWDVIVDGLIGSYGLEFIKSPSDAIKDIELRKNEIFRDSRRGKYLIKDIDDEISKLGEEIRELDSSVTAYHSLSQELERAKEDKAKLKKDLAHLKNVESSILSLLDDKKNLSIINSFKDSYGLDNADMRHVLERLNTLMDFEKNFDDIRARKAGLDAEVEMLNSEDGKLTDEEAWLLRKKPDLIVARNLISNISLGLEKSSLKNNEADRIYSQIKSDEIKMFGRELCESERADIEKLDVISLSSYVDGSSLKDNTNGKKLGLFLASAVSAMIGGLGVYFNVDWAFYLGLVLTGLSLGLLYGEIRSDNGSNTGKEELIKVLGNIPVPAVYVKDIDGAYFKSLSTMCPIYTQLRSVKEEADEIISDLEKTWDRLISILEDEDIKTSERLNLSIIKKHMDKLYERLDEIRAKEISENSKKLKLNGLVDRLSELDTAADELSHNIKNNSSEFINEFNLSLENLDKLKRDIKRVEDVADMEDQLMSSYDIHDKILRIAELEKSGYEINLDKVEEIKVQCDDIIAKITSFEKNEGTLTEKISSIYDAGERENQIGRVGYLKRERKKLLLKRAVLSTAQDIIEQYDSEFRAKNQPDIIKRAAHYFSKITQGRYNDIYTDERSRSFFLTTPHGEKSIDGGFSRGTREQLYLSLRLAIIEHLDKSNETKLPLILDDVFVNWDKDRLSGVKELVYEIADQRQVIMFTCHESQAELFKDGGKSNIIFL